MSPLSSTHVPGLAVVQGRFRQNVLHVQCCACYVSRTCALKFHYGDIHHRRCTITGDRRGGGAGSGSSFIRRMIHWVLLSCSEHGHHYPPCTWCNVSCILGAYFTPNAYKVYVPWLNINHTFCSAPPRSSYTASVGVFLCN